MSDIDEPRWLSVRSLPSSGLMFVLRLILVGLACPHAVHIRPTLLYLMYRFKSVSSTCLLCARIQHMYAMNAIYVRVTCTRRQINTNPNSPDRLMDIILHMHVHVHVSINVRNLNGSDGI